MKLEVQLTSTSSSVGGLEEVEVSVAFFLDFLEAFLQFEVLGFSFLFLHNSKVINNYTQNELVLY